MANKILDVRSVMDEMVSPEGLQAGGGSQPEFREIDLSPSEYIRAFEGGAYYFGESELLRDHMYSCNIKAYLTGLADVESGTDIPLFTIPPVFASSVKNVYFSIANIGSNLIAQGVVKNHTIYIENIMDPQNWSGSQITFDFTAIDQL